MAKGFGLTAVAVLWVILLVRVGGLRSLAKMTGFDFVTTIATGSLIATAGTASSLIEFAGALAAIAALFAVQFLLGASRTRWQAAQRLIGNDPVLLMEDGRFLEDAMRAERIVHGDIYAKMREAGVEAVDEVRAVVLERTGDISIVRTSSIDERILSDIEGVSRGKG